ncbi:universal stress protein [Terrabacter sp. MAHUQ-38]|uniref:universal stress protein n=1 Tax=unclassified Terrabacter TaxID=2630222 RepID=UPI00165D67AB|nr:universal stress protein [Terrabacter sp. MAHUQ-38]
MECTFLWSWRTLDHEKIAEAGIVVGIDTSRESSLALEWAAHEAARRHVPLQILHAYSPDHPVAGAAFAGTALPPTLTEATESVAQRACAVAATTAQTLHPDLVITTRPEPSTPAGALVEASRTAGMVVLGARGLGAVRSILLGSVSIHVAAHAHCPVVVVREAATRTLPDPRVIVGVDGYHSTGAVRFAFEQAAMRDLGLTVVHTWQLDGVEAADVSNARAVDREVLDLQERALLSESIAGFREEFPTVDVRRHVVQRHPVEELVRLSENACLLVVGTRGRGSLAGLVEGSVSQGVLRRALVLSPLSTL